MTPAASVKLQPIKQQQSNVIRQWFGIAFLALCQLLAAAYGYGSLKSEVNSIKDSIHEIKQDIRDMRDYHAMHETVKEHS